jgi:hypothetical protein
MQTATAMNVDIKALLTLLLLKSGTSSREIQTVLMVAATSRVIVAEETAVPQRPANPLEGLASNVAAIRPAVRLDATDFDPNAVSMHSDIKALLTLVLLQSGVNSDDIQTTLRLAAASRASMTETHREASAPINIAERAANLPADIRPMAAKQALRADHLAPISMREFAAA